MASVEMAMAQERGVQVVQGCGCCVYCYLGAPLNCHRVRGGDEPAEGLSTVVMSVPIDAERCEWAADEMVNFLELGGLLAVVGVGADFRMRLGRFLFSVGLQGLVQQFIENAEAERRRLAEEGNREFDRVFGGTVEEVETQREM